MTSSCLEELQEKASYENGVLESAKVQEFMILLECMSEKVNYNLNHFKDMSDDEKVIITQKYIEAVYECNENSKFLAFIGYEFQMVVHKIRSFIKNVMKFIKYNFEDLRNGKYTYQNCYKLKNLVVFVGELYVSPYKIVLSIVLTDFLTILIEQNSNLPHGFAFDCVVTSLRLCGFLYKYDDPTNYQKIIDKLKELANNNNYRMQIVREIEDISSELDDFKTDEHEKSPILQEKLNDIYKKRSFKSNESAISHTNLQYFILNLIDHQDVKFDYSDMYFTKSDELYNTAKWLCKTVNENKNVIIVAEFLKSFYTYSCQIADLLSLLKRNLASRISKKFVPDGYNDMLTIGIIIAELQNLKVFDENLGNIWIHKIESFDPTNNDEILKIELRVLSRMMPYANITGGDQSQEIYHILREIGKVEKIKKLLAERDEKLDATDDKISLSENEKEILFYKKKISENLPAWNIDARLKQILYFAKTGVHVENIPQMNETTAMIFSNVFFVNCISNQYTIKNYMKALVQLCQNKIFKMYFIRVCQMNFEKLLESNKFVDTEWDGILMLLVLTFKEKIITEKIVLKILETLKDEKHAEFFSFFINALVKETHVLENPYSEKFKENITQALILIERRKNKE